MAQSVAILGVAIVVTYFIAKLVVKSTISIYKSLPNIEQPTEDYWDDAGDGSGVNYVPMSDGSVRID